MVALFILTSSTHPVPPNLFWVLIQATHPSKPAVSAPAKEEMVEFCKTIFSVKLPSRPLIPA